MNFYRRYARLSSILGLVIAMFCLSACRETPKEEAVLLGTATISEHSTPVGSFNRRECQFRVAVTGHTFTFTGSLANPIAMNKCKAMKDGDEVAVSEKFQLFKDGHKEQDRYVGKVNEVEFVLR